MKANKKTILLVSAISPFPNDNGGAVRILNTLNYLSVQFNIVFVFFKSHEYKLSIAEQNLLGQKTFKSIAIDLKSRKTASGFLTDFQPYWFTDWLNDEVKILLPILVKKYKVDIIQIEFTQLCYLFNYLPSDIPKVFIAHDISTISFKRRLAEIKKPTLKISHFLRWLEVYFYEKRYLPKFDLVVTMSEKDKSSLKKGFSLRHIYVAPNGISEVKSKPKKKINKLKGINLGYIGSFSHSPNQFAINYFLTNLGPLLEKRKIPFQFFIAGNNSTDIIESFINKSLIKKKQNVINLGRVKDVSEFYEKIDILVAPIFSGSGTRIKILESLNYQTPVITTFIGAEGLEDLQSAGLEITQSDNEFVDAIQKFSTSEQYLNYSSLKKYLWKDIMKNYANYLLNHFHLI